MRLLTKPHFFVSKATKRNMLNCIIIEDDFAFALDLRIKAEEIGLNVIDMVSHFDEIHGAVTNNSIDVILSDVKLDSGNYSYEYFKGKEDLPPIIFFSSYKDDEQYMNSKDANPYVYLVKPFDTLTLRSAIDGALRSQLSPESTNNNVDIQGKSIFLRSKGKLVSLKYNDIKYIESEGNYCTFNCRGNKIAIRSSIKKVLQQIDSSEFIQVQRAFVVNIEFIKELKFAESEIVLEDTVIPIGRKYKRNVIDTVSGFKN